MLEGLTHIRVDPLLVPQSHYRHLPAYHETAVAMGRANPHAYGPCQSKVLRVHYPAALQ